MKIALGSDHAGYEYKQAIIQKLKEQGYDILDVGTHSEVSCDYPDFIAPAAAAVPQGKADRAIVLGGSGNGEAIAANKIKGVRCVLCWNAWTAEFGRKHNDANCLSIGARTLSLDAALEIVHLFLTTNFEGGRHIPRIQKVAHLEEVFGSHR